LSLWWYTYHIETAQGDLKMAYVNKEKKAKIVAAVKAVLPKSWKATFAVRNGSGIVMTIKSSPFTLENLFGKEACDAMGEYHYIDGALGHVDVNHRYLERHIKNKEALEILKKVVKALDTDNHNNSDIMTDYFDVGHYVELQFGNYDKAYVATAA